ncbi:MAG: prepilin-type N-terminal cleavage/methylation domain-containing protein [Pseudomonadota bacterium]
MPHSKRNRVRAFSLVELSIVLVILGLLVGGVLSGKSLIRASEIRSISTDANRYLTAMYTFRDKYFAVPGDMANAGQFWGMINTGGAGGQCAAPLTDTGTGTQTCNGDGDGKVVGGEWFRAWQHLTSAGLVEGTYSGIADPAGANLATPGLNVPQSRVNNAGFTLMYSDPVTSETGSWFKNKGGNLLSFGKRYTVSETRVAAITPEDAWNVDTKMDDGKPGSGKVMGRRDLGACTDTDVTETAAYLLTVTDIGCSLRFFLN